jgi:hypothetical protein
MRRRKDPADRWFMYAVDLASVMSSGLWFCPIGPIIKAERRQELIGACRSISSFSPHLDFSCFALEQRRQILAEAAVDCGLHESSALVLTDTTSARLDMHIVALRAIGFAISWEEKINEAEEDKMK